jgi:uncharacterized protein (TIGR03083 family)
MVRMADDSELDGLDPFDLLDEEAARLDAYFSDLPASEWERPSRCVGWSIRDVLAHLASAEEYHHACLDGRVSDLLAQFAARGATDITSANALGIADRSDRSPAQVLEEWRDTNAGTRRRFRERGDGTIDTSVGEYPNRWQAFHVASELAIHADDVYVPEVPDEREHRRGWQARFTRFALAEAKPDLTIGLTNGRTHVRGDDLEVDVDDHELIEAFAGRLDESSRLDASARALLCAMP